MKKAIGALAILLAAAAAGVYFSDPGQPVEPAAPPPPAYTIPTPEPPEPWREPARAHWGVCGAQIGQEDAALRAVLASPLTEDPLFGGTEVRMEAASCAAARERLAWMATS